MPFTEEKETRAPLRDNGLQKEEAAKAKDDENTRTQECTELCRVTECEGGGQPAVASAGAACRSASTPVIEEPCRKAADAEEREEERGLCGRLVGDVGTI